MKPSLSRQRCAAMTLFEVGVVVAIVMILVAMILPALQSTRNHHSNFNCVNNLKQIGLAGKIWAGDNNDLYPMGVALALGGSKEMVATGNVVQTFQVLSNELGTPKILVCRGVGLGRGDTNRTAATNFARLSNANISYFISVDATNDMNPRQVVFGDGNFEIGGRPVKAGLHAFGTNEPVVWGTNWHQSVLGNLAFADGRVESATIVSWTHVRNFQMTGLATNRFAVP
jgi:prepilin-type processing-associated H-X9-DG protein